MRGGLLGVYAVLGVTGASAVFVLGYQVCGLVNRLV